MTDESFLFPTRAQRVKRLFLPDIQHVSLYEH